MTKVKWLVPVVPVLILSGCASPAGMEHMTCTLPCALSYDRALQHAVDITTTSGGKETNPLLTSEISIEAFSEAVKSSLMNQGLYAAGGRYQLQIHMNETTLDRVMDIFTVTTHVRYILTDSSTDTVVLDETIAAPNTAMLSDAFYGPKRLRLANEGSGKKNITRLLIKLSELEITTNMALPDKQQSSSTSQGGT